MSNYWNEVERDEASWAEMEKPDREKDLDHIHVFEIVTKKVLLHDERKLATGEETVGGDTVAYDVLRQFKCACGKTQTIDLKRTQL